MTSLRARPEILARILPPAAMVCVAAACLVFVRAAAPAADPSGLAAEQAGSLAVPAWITAALAAVAAAVLGLSAGESLIHRAGGILGMSAAAGAAFGGVLNLLGYLNSNVWWAADAAGLRAAAAALLVVGLLGLAVVGAEQLRPGWRRR